MAPSKICISRLTKEHKDLVKQPLDGIHAVPDPKCITEWHFLLQGAPDTDYEGGLYYGKLLFPDTYPQAGPAVRMLTPSGRFDPGKDICMSMTNFHPESWNPMWRVSSILAGLQSFMVEEVITTGGVRATSQERRRFALGSIEYNKRFNKLKTLFPEVIAAAESAAASVASGKQ
ncbi:unnamed protein product [Pedinophyceae sp. YPF-701]|nr:unnamed protein product [Pedinophyceae sp. YPF-701]